jgi:hypothetical protein
LEACRPLSWTWRARSMDAPGSAPKVPQVITLRTRPSSGPLCLGSPAAMTAAALKRQTTSTNPIRAHQTTSRSCTRGNLGGQVSSQYRCSKRTERDRRQLSNCFKAKPPNGHTPALRARLWPHAGQREPQVGGRVDRRRGRDHHAADHDDLLGGNHYAEHPNTLLLRRPYKAVESRDLDALNQLIPEDSRWHVEDGTPQRL